jgi:GNAT superfamily N-acetyltransferase
VPDKLARCLPVYAAAGLRPYARITPFSEPPDLEATLAGLGWERVDDTRVMVAQPLPRPLPLPAGFRLEAADAASFTAWIGAARGSSASEEAAHAERVAASPVTYRALLACDPAGRAVAGGQIAIEDDIAGLYDVFSHEDQRGRGLAGALCSALLDLARDAGARVAYLQVDAGNEAARSVYRRLGFVDAYAYHYRTPAAENP